MKKIELGVQTKKNIGIAIGIIIVMAIITLVAMYIANDKFRTNFDKYILQKEIEESKSTFIEIKSEENAKIYAYDKYVTVLNKNKLEAYSSSGKKEYELDVQVSDALFNSNNRFLVVAQKSGQKAYLISENNRIWQKEIEGEIKKIVVNKNGYVCIIVSDATYKSIIITYNPSGKEIFKTYLSSTIAIDVAISNDNKYLAVAEVNTSGTLIQSNIKIISIEKAQSDPTNSVITNYSADSNKLITGIKYQDKNKLIGMYDSEINCFFEGNNEFILDFNDNKITFASIELNNHIITTSEKNSGIFSSTTQVTIRNVQTQKESIYTTKNVVKSMKNYSEHIALNYGSEVEFINNNGWLMKKYVASQEIKDIVLSDKIAGIVLKDKIEIINL